MKIKNLWHISLVSLTLLAGCGKEPQNVTGETQTNCINVTLKMSNPVTKAGEVFDNGSGLESNIDKVFFAFFNAQGVCVATSHWDTPSFNTNETGNSIEQYKTDKVEFELPVGAKLPVSMMVYVNPIDLKDLNMTLAEAKSKTRNSYVGTTTNYGFAMNNAVYFDASGNKQVEVITPAENYYPKGSGDGVAAVTAYVERMAVKVSLEYKENYQNDAISLSNAGVENKIKFVPDNWGITCTEKKMYLVKHFNDSYTTSFVENDNNVFAGWNDVNNHRSYWANSVSYGLDKSAYPDVSDDLIVSPAAFFQQNFNTFDKTTYPIAYLSYNQISGTPANPLYSNENTIRNFVPSAATSVIIKGHYVYAEGANAGTNVGTFYVRGSDFYTEKTLKNFFTSIPQTSKSFCVKV